ncbi:MAG: hypothetical protein KF745_13435 [Phycisphaeraceae bacterium]|nr:hypothetical protein [Phycisphaeraceae bacterium]
MKLHVPAAITLVLACVGSAMAQSDACGGATAAVPGQTYTGTTVGATRDGAAQCSGSSSSPDVWYSFTNTQSEPRLLVVSLCGSSYDTYLSIHTGCPGTVENQIACNDDSCGTRSVTQATVDPGITVVIRVGGYTTSVGAFSMTLDLQDPPPPPSTGPDVIVGDLIDVANYGAVGGFTAYAVGTTSCNAGDVPVEWISGTNRHPLIAQNMYRLMNGRFEQIGQSWLKHAFLSVNGSLCGSCISPPNGGSQLGINCSDPYGSGLNGSQSNLGPRSHVNATTGQYPYPFTSPGPGYITPPAAQGTIGRRIQVPTTDVTPAMNPGAVYFVEGHYVTSDDAMANNGRNNASYRKISVASATANPAFIGATFRQLPAIVAWQAEDPSVTLVPVDYLEGTVLARIWVGAKSTSNGDGTWTYEYAFQNLNSHRSVGSFSVGMPVSASVTGIGFHAPTSHSGEPYSNAAWTSSRVGATFSMGCTPFATDENANAARWGTLYNVRFTSSVAPVMGSATLGLFRPGTPDSVTVPGIPVPTAACAADWNQSGVVDVADIALFVNSWVASIAAPDLVADFDHNGAVEPVDVAAFVQAWVAAVANGC